MSLRTKSGIAAVALEISAPLLLLWHGTEQYFVATSLLLHGAAILLELPLIVPLANRSGKRISAGRLTLLLLLAAGLPLLGIVVIGCLYFAHRRSYELGRIGHFDVLSDLTFRDLKTGEERPLRIDELTDQLQQQDATSTDRMRALLSIQQMPSRTTSNLLRHALGDGADDIRLLAYGLLDRREKEIAKRIELLGKLLHTGRETGRPGRPLVLRELAELYWELVYQRLVQGDVRKFCVEQVMHYATSALRRDREDAGLWLLLGRAKMLTEDYAGAQADFNSAVALGIPYLRIAPYLAELAFLKRDFSTVRHIIGNPLDGIEPATPICCSYWLPKGHHS